VPLILGGGDVLAAAETGSGKTAAFGMPILQIVHEALRESAAPAAAAAAPAASADASAAGAYIRSHFSST
jgi:ATP-dependent RNA helicase DDX1